MSPETVLTVVASSFGIVMGASPLLQIRKMLAQRSSDQVSIGYFAILALGSTLWGSYAVDDSQHRSVHPQRRRRGRGGCDNRGRGQPPSRQRCRARRPAVVPVACAPGGATHSQAGNAARAHCDIVSPLVRSREAVRRSVVTRAINIAAQLVMRPQIKTVLTGGVVQARSYELVGPYSAVVLEKITMDIAFIGVNGIDPVMGATVHDEREASVNSLMARRATRAVIVADSSKIGRRAFATLSQNTFNTFITDSAISASQLAAFADRGIEVIVA